MYMASYIVKTERSMGKLLKRVAAEARTEEMKTQLRKVGSATGKLVHKKLYVQNVEYCLYL